MLTEKGFIVDAMLGKLAKYLRILGYDTLYSRSIKDNEIITICVNTNRIIVTRDRALCYKAWKNNCDCIYISKPQKVSTLLAYIGFILGTQLEFDTKNTRCPLCNEKLVVLPPDEIKKTGLKKYSTVYRCPSCNNLYWKGSHWRGIKRNIEEARKCLKTLLNHRN